MTMRVIANQRFSQLSWPPGDIDVHHASLNKNLTHLQRLEAEAIHIFREVAATFSNPVMLYSVGKDSSVMLHLAMKAFYPAPPPFPFLHVDTTWKFREMIEFRDAQTREKGFELLVHINEDGVRDGVGPFTHGSNVHTHVMKTVGLRQALDKYKFDAAFGGARRDEEKSRAKERIFHSAMLSTAGTRRTSARKCGRFIIPAFLPVNRSVSSRFPIGPNSISGSISCRKISRLCRFILPLPPGGGARRHVDQTR